ncbi:unnamed protein product [Coffea canephora]|uniref:Uncharacterized protein n=1 Tax=Coffea canephora TaxID=49390 RepID=A0A068UFD8_COFCA|nr:unnamed protein product [Coffea canephora]
MSLFSFERAANFSLFFLFLLFFFSRTFRALSGRYNLEELMLSVLQSRRFVLT